MVGDRMAVDPASGKLLPVDVVRVGDTMRLVVNLGSATVTLSASEIEIGHVALKNDASEDHQTVAPDGQAVNGTYPLEGAAFMAHDPNGNRWRILRVDDDDQLVVATKNRADFRVNQISTGGVADTPIVGPSQAVPNGFGVLVQADVGNTEAVEVGGVGDTGAAATRFTLQPGDVLPITLNVDNFNKIEARSVAGTNEIVKLVAEI